MNFCWYCSWLHKMNTPLRILGCFCIWCSVEEKPCYHEELKCLLWTDNQECYCCNHLLCIRFCFLFVHLQHSRANNLDTVCALYHNVCCAYTPSDRAMALFRKKICCSEPFSAREFVLLVHFFIQGWFIFLNRYVSNVCCILVWITQGSNTAYPPTPTSVILQRSIA